MADESWDEESKAHPLAIKAWQYVSLQTQIEALQTQAKAVGAEIVRDFPDGVGTFTQTYDDARITVTRGERWNWDREDLATIMATKPADPVTNEIRAAMLETLHISRNSYAKLSVHAQAALAPALTIKDGPAKIEVEKQEPAP